MTMSFDQFSQLCDHVNALGNPDPSYLPTQEDLEKLIRLNRTLRPAFRTKAEREARKRSNSSYHIGRPYVIEKGISFITRGAENEPLIPDDKLYPFLIYLSETTVPISREGEQMLSTINSFLRENLTVE